MSLITLKNDNNQQPYNWRNYFKSPLVLPPHSSVSLQSAVIRKKDDIDVTDSENFYFRIGAYAGNPTYRGELSSLEFSQEDLASAMKEEIEENCGQLAFCNTDSTSPSGWDFTFNPTTKKMTVVNTQSAMPLPTQLPLITAPDVGYWSGQNQADPLWAKFRRNGLTPPAPPTELVCGALFAEAQVPRNGGHIIFRPEVLSGAFGTQYPVGTKFGLTSSNKDTSEVSYYSDPLIPVANPPFGFGFHILGDGATPSTIQVTTNRGWLYDDTEQDFRGVVVDMLPATQYTFCMEWTTPYSILFKHSTNFDPSNPATDFENATWTTMYDMNAGGAVHQIPTFQDNMGMILECPHVGSNVWVRGTFASGADEMGNYSWLEDGFDRTGGGSSDGTTTSGVFVLGENAVVGDDKIVGTYPNQFLEKEIQFLWETAPTIPTATLQVWENSMFVDIVSTHLGTLLGFTTDQILTLTPDATFQINTATGDHNADPTNILPTLHIQLTNFAIESKNGIVSNNVKDIAVIPLWEAGSTSATQQLHYQAGFENKVNLNNLQEITVNQIDVMITTDNNKPAEILKNYSTIVIKLHKGIEDGDEGYEKGKANHIYQKGFGRFQVDNLPA